MIACGGSLQGGPALRACLTACARAQSTLASSAHYSARTSPNRALFFSPESPDPVDLADAKHGVSASRGVIFIPFFPFSALLRNYRASKCRHQRRHLTPLFPMHEPNLSFTGLQYVCALTVCSLRARFNVSSKNWGKIGRAGTWPTHAWPALRQCIIQEGSVLLSSLTQETNMTC